MTDKDINQRFNETVINIYLTMLDNYSPIPEVFIEDEETIKCFIHLAYISGVNSKAKEIVNLKSELDRHKELLRVQCNKTQDLSANLEKAKAALEFYAKESNWIITAENEFSQIKRTISKDDSESWSYQSSPESKSIVQCYGGKRARQVLKELE